MDRGARQATYSPRSSKELDTTEHTCTCSDLHINLYTLGLFLSPPQRPLLLSHPLQCGVSPKYCKLTLFCKGGTVFPTRRPVVAPHFLELLLRILCSGYLIFQNFR